MQSSSSEAAAYDRWADYYDLLDADRAPFIAFYNGLVDARTGSVLDLGCGTGTIAIAVDERLAALREGREPARIVGVDGSEGMLRVARTRNDQIEWRSETFATPVWKAHSTWPSAASTRCNTS